jgi:hypothetical protein
MKIKTIIIFLVSILEIFYCNAQVSTSIQNTNKIQPSVIEKIDSCKLILKSENPKFAVYYKKLGRIYSIESNLDNIDTNFISDIRVMSSEQYKRIFGKSIDELGVIEIKYLCDTFKPIPQIVRPYHTSHISDGKVKELSLKEKKYQQRKNKKDKRNEQKQKNKREMMLKNGELITPLVKVTFNNENENDLPFLLLDMKGLLEETLQKIEIEKDQAINGIINILILRAKDASEQDFKVSPNSTIKDQRMIGEVYSACRKFNGKWASFTTMKNGVRTYYEIAIEFVFN